MLFNAKGTRDLVDRLFGPDAAAWALVSGRRLSVAIEGRVIAEQVRLLALSGRCESAVATLFAVCVAVILWSTADRLVLCLWLVSSAVLVLIRTLLEQRYRQTARDIRDSSHPRWARRFCTCSVAAGVLWGGGAVWSIPAADPGSAAVLLALHIGYVALACGLHGAYVKAFLAYSVPALIGLGVALTMRGDVSSVQSLALLVAVGAGSTLFAYRSARIVTAGLRKRFASDELSLALAEERDQAELATQAKNRFLSTASHDLRQPVLAIGLLVSLLQSRQSGPGSDGIIDKIQQSIASLTDLFDGIMDVSRLDSKDAACVPQAVSLNALLGRLEATFEIQAQSRGLSLDIACPSGTTVVADPTLLERVLMNLIGNAIKFTAAGSVRVSVEARDGKRVVRVRDTGCGIPESEQERVFSAYQQVACDHPDQDAGHGLGLAIVRRSCQLMEAPVSLSSVPGKGSEFSVSLRTADACATGARVQRLFEDSPNALEASRKAVV